MFKEIPVSERQDKRGMKRSKVRGIGINDAPYLTSYKLNGTHYECPYFMRWRVMLDRCYSPTWLKKHPTYQGCTVAPEWHSFMAFRSWMETKDWKGKQLDKDLLSKGAKIYSPDTCIFVSSTVNSLFTGNTSSQSNLPMGIYQRNGKYEVGVSCGKSKRSWVGAYKTVPEAIDAYLSAKKTAMEITLQSEGDPAVRAAVKDYFRHFSDTLCLLKAAY